MEEGNKEKGSNGNTRREEQQGEKGSFVKGYAHESPRNITLWKMYANVGHLCSVIFKRAKRPSKGVIQVN